MHAGRIAEHNGGDVEALHTRNGIFEVFAFGSGIELGRALLGRPSEGSFFGRGIGPEKVVRIGTHRSAAREGLRHGVNVDIDDERDGVVGVLSGERGGEEKNGEGGTKADMHRVSFGRRGSIAPVGAPDSLVRTPPAETLPAKALKFHAMPSP
jgi:hypothetical protein